MTCRLEGGALMHAEHAHNEDMGGIESMIDLDPDFVEDEVYEVLPKQACSQAGLFVVYSMETCCDVICYSAGQQTAMFFHILLTTIQLLGSAQSVNVVKYLSSVDD